MKKNIILLSLLLLGVSQSLRAAVVILNGLTHVHPIGVNQSISGSVVLRNESDVPKRIIIYKEDVTANCGQDIKYGGGFHMRSLTKWLSTTVDEKTLQPLEEFTLFYTIDAPAEMESGSYWTVLMIEGANPVNEVQPNGVSVNSVMRYAVQIIGDNGTSGKSGLLVSDLSMNDVSDSTKMMHVTVKNDGVFSEKVKLYLEVYDEDGNHVETFKTLSRRIYPDMCSSYSLKLFGLSKGRYESVLVMDNDKDLFASNISLDID